MITNYRVNEILTGGGKINYAFCSERKGLVGIGDRDCGIEHGVGVPYLYKGANDGKFIFFQNILKATQITKRWKFITRQKAV